MTKANRELGGNGQYFKGYGKDDPLYISIRGRGNYYRGPGDSPVNNTDGGNFGEGRK